MTRYALLAIVLCLAVPAFAADAIFDDFEDADVSDWGGSAGFTTAAVLVGGANSTAYAVEFGDGGWGMNIKKTATGIVPNDGCFKLTFYYINGHVDNPQNALKVYFNGGNAVDLGSAAVTSWTAQETGVIGNLLAGGDVEVEMTGTYSGGLTQKCAFDELVLTECLCPPQTIVTLLPPSGYIVEGTQVLTATATGGIGTFVSAAFDVGDDGVDYVDSTPEDGFTFDWDTGALTDPLVKCTITDDQAAIGEAYNTYILQSTGRESLLLNGGFESWTGGLPDNWETVYWYGNDGTSGNESNVTISEDTSGPVAGSSLKINFAATDYSYRYTMKSNDFPGDRQSYQLWYYGKGGSDCRMGYWATDDTEGAWTFTWRLIANSSSADTWEDVLDSAYAGAGTKYLCVATHKFDAGDGYWDEVEVCADESAPVGDWYMY